ncbi:coproporphyrinogen dehydrogenase HemZ [Christensenella tenuis]|uniref:Coproporphyrinogen dehydrogenase HemZ n=1 Tax=Christensenella tenuis TaxID=2763033 RepID=A0ABR7ECN9_9FIRM|nr:coproporphyrinogen dehydrogenase HemZ [Christensenella tenuis]MBC5647106.1 coproporphyrinogen dehydrogenase HemZ [Christensenella tenuis]
MFSLYTETPSFFNDICEEIRLFLPEEKQIIQLDDKNETNAGKLIRHFFWHDEAGWHNKVEYYEDGRQRAASCELPIFTDDNGDPVDITANTLLARKLKKHAVKHLIYRVMQEAYQKSMPWGSLTGIRPTKLFRELAARHGTARARRIFTDRYDVSRPKTRLAEKICAVQAPFISHMDGQELDIYIGIPFCVSRCKYCSFISRDLKFNETIKDQYLPCLLHEMEAMKDIVEKYRIRSVYIGGGTPTALSDHDLATVLEAVNKWFPDRLEFTVEAGRPDTVTATKLRILKEHGVERISINAQTANDRTLELIGRKHTLEDFKRAFSLANTYGFQSINTDIILGLPHEGLRDVEKTLAEIMKFEPDNVTVHTLAIKQSSAFAEERQNDLPGAETVSEMVDLAQEFLSAKGYLPYYLYRQKYMSGNLENVGFALPGKECIYNIDIMEETVSNLAFGAGAISKKLFLDQNLIKRAPNVKDLKNYIDRTEEMIGRKKELF